MWVFIYQGWGLSLASVCSLWRGIIQGVCKRRKVGNHCFTHWLRNCSPPPLLQVLRLNLPSSIHGTWLCFSSHKSQLSYFVWSYAVSTFSLYSTLKWWTPNYRTKSMTAVILFSIFLKSHVNNTGKLTVNNASERKLKFFRVSILQSFVKYCFQELGKRDGRKTPWEVLVDQQNWPDIFDWSS